jgi:replication initiation and membrane attachment protein DnaB
LYANIAVQTGTNVIINDIAKKVIEKYFNVYKLTTKEVENIINQSICTNSDNFVEVDVDLLEHQMQRHVQSIQNIDLARNIEINRNAKIFNKYCPQNELLPIFSDYKAFNAEQYLKAIIKCNLSDTDLKTIKILREKYLLNDGIINMITDLTLNRANGQFNPKYATKVAHTVNALDLKTFDKIYNY